MFFNSITFLIFLSIVCFFFWNVNKSFRVGFLVFSSCIFYGFWRWDFLLLILFSTVLDYTISILIDRNDDNNKRKIYLLISIITNLSLLAYFKYLYFIVDNINFAFGSNISLYEIILPFGISFYTFETISYTTDVYRRLIKPESNFLRYALFVTFFPKLVAGPIQRTKEFLDQVINPNKFSLDNLFKGLKRIIEGLFLKVVLADNLSAIVDDGFNINPDILSGVDVMTLSALFGFQIYFDFAGYSSIAIGCALLLGFKIPENFNYPYISKSFKEFWKRWHISLSSWIRDYLYLPLLGVKVLETTAKGGIGNKLDQKKGRNKNLILFITWAIMGLWHGANWTFILWGLIHATLIFIERIRTKYITFKTNTIINWVTVYIFSMLSWIPFRAENIENTLTMYSKLFDLGSFINLNLRENYYLIAFILTLLFLMLYNFRSYKLAKNKIGIFIIDVSKITLMVVLTYIFLRPIQQFIYFQF